MNVSFKFSLFLTTNYENSSRAADLVSWLVSESFNCFSVSLKLFWSTIAD